jgi:hypothetical protein
LKDKIKKKVKKDSIKIKIKNLKDRVKKKKKNGVALGFYPNVFSRVNLMLNVEIKKKSNS